MGAMAMARSCGHPGLCFPWAFLGLGTEKSHWVWGRPLSLCLHGIVWVANTLGKIYDLEKKKEKTKKTTARPCFPGCLLSFVENFLPMGSCGKAVSVPE